MERIELPAHSTWVCGSRQEAWLLVLDGSAVIAGLDVSVSDAVFLEDDQVDIAAGPDGLRYLLSYVGSEPSPVLSRGRDGQDAGLSRNYSTEALA
jgi:mannose-6-phosphate isomerase